MNAQKLGKCGHSKEINQPVLYVNLQLGFYFVPSLLCYIYTCCLYDRFTLDLLIYVYTCICFETGNDQYTNVR